MEEHITVNVSSYKVDHRTQVPTWKTAHFHSSEKLLLVETQFGENPICTVTWRSQATIEFFFVDINVQMSKYAKLSGVRNVCAMLAKLSAWNML